jgi:hypothetical protein
MFDIEQSLPWGKFYDAVVRYKIVNVNGVNGVKSVRNDMILKGTQ